MDIQLFRKDNPIITLPLEAATYTDEKMGIQELVFSLEISSVLDIQIGDTLTYNSEQMHINYTPDYGNAGEFRRSYTITFEGHRATLYDQPLVDEGDVTFSYFGDAVDLLNLILSNINSLDPGWTAGAVEAVEPQHFQFDNVSCLAALNTIAERFGLEWKITQRVITLKKNIGVERAVTLSQGRGNGLYDLRREYLKDSNMVTRAYALGSTQNLPESYKGKRLSLPDYIESNVDKYGVKVRYYTFDDVFPHRTGTATAVSKVNDKSYTLTDTAIDFDINGQRAGENDVKIVFKSGSLNGQEFVVTRYDHNTKTITYKANEDSNGLLIPFSATVAEVGDQYILVGLIMPQPYIDTAKAELITRRAEALTRDSVPKVVYSLNSDVLFLKENGLLLAAGDIVRVQDADVGLDELLTIQRVSYPAIFPQQLIKGMRFVAEVGNVSYAKINDKLYKDVQDQKIISGQIRRNAAELSRVNASALRELQNYIFDADDYFDTARIKPQSIETQMLSVGAKSQNFYLSAVTMQPNFTGDANKFHISGGQLQHREISIAAGFIWVLNPQTFQNLNPAKVYYLSAKCSKVQLIGTYNLTEAPLKVENEAGFYNFNIGVLYPVGADGKRFFANTSGVTYVVGSQLTTGRIKSLDGNTWFDLDTGEIRGAITFSNGQSVQDAIDQAKGEAVAQSGVATQQAIANLTIGSKNWLKFSDTTEVFEIYGVTGNISTVVDLSQPSGKTIKLANIVRQAGFGDLVFFIPIANNPIIINREPLNGKEVTISFNIKTNSPQIISGVGTYMTPTIVDSTWRKISLTYTMGLVGNLHFSLSGDNLQTLDVSSFKIELGNKATDWQPAPEDLQRQIVDTDNARKAYIDAQDNLKETQTKAYADGIVDAEEARAIADATNKANAAKAYADAQDILLKVQTNAYADGIVDAEEAERIAQAQSNLIAAKAYAEAQDNLTKVEANAYADGKVTAEEQRAIQDATNKANAAKAYADAQDILLKVQTNAYADGIVDAEEAERIAQAQSNLNAAKAYAEAQDNLTKVETKAYADGIVDAEEARAIADAQAKLQEAKNHAENKAFQAEANAVSNTQQAIANLTIGSKNWLKFSDTTEVFEIYGVTGNISTVVDLSQPSGKTIKLTNIVRQAGFDDLVFFIPIGNNPIIINREPLAGKEVVISFNIKTNSPQIISGVGTYMTPTIVDSTWRKISLTYTMGLVGNLHFRLSGDNLQTLDVSSFKIELGNKATDWQPAPEDLQRQIVDTDNARKAYIDAQDNLKETQTKAYADGKVTAEEQRAIQDATNKANAAKSYADVQDAALQAIVNQYTDNKITPLQVLINELKTKTGIEALPSGKTIVNGGQIDTDLLNAIAVRALIMSVGLLTASEIDVNSLFAQYIEATNMKVTGSSKIGVFDIIGNGLRSYSGGTIATQTGDEFAGLGRIGLDDVWSIAYFKAKLPPGSLYSSALTLHASGAQYNTALQVDKGDVIIDDPLSKLEINAASIIVAGKGGYTGKVQFNQNQNIRYLNYTNGIMTGVTTS